MKQNLIDLKAYDLCLERNLFNIFSLFLIGIIILISSRRLHILIRINGSFVTKIQSKPRLTDTSLLRTVFSLSLGKEIRYIFSDSTRLICDIPLVRALCMAPSVPVLAGFGCSKDNFGWVRVT